MDRKSRILIVGFFNYIQVISHGKVGVKVCRERQDSTFQSLFAFRSCKLLYVGGLQEQGACSRNFVVVNFNLQEQGACSQNVVVVNSDLQEQGTCSQTYLVSQKIFNSLQRRKCLVALSKPDT